MTKRFYKQVSIQAKNGGFEILLDGRVLKTPGKLPLLCQSQHHADLLASEWDAQEDIIKPETMPCTRLYNVALELTPKNRPALVKEARQYASTDLLSYRAESKQSELVRRQEELWNPILDWARTRDIDLKYTDSLIAIDQDKTSLDKVAAYADSLDDLHLTLYLHFTAVYGSAILSMAVLDNHLPAIKGFELSRLDAAYQIEQWGEDEDAQIATDKLRNEIQSLSMLIGD